MKPNRLGAGGGQGGGPGAESWRPEARLARGGSSSVELTTPRKHFTQRISPPAWSDPYGIPFTVQGGRDFRLRFLSYCSDFLLGGRGRRCLGAWRWRVGGTLSLL